MSDDEKVTKMELVPDCTGTLRWDDARSGWQFIPNAPPPMFPNAPPSMVPNVGPEGGLCADRPPRLRRIKDILELGDCEWSPPTDEAPELGVKQDAGKLDASLLTEPMMLALMAPEKHLSPVGLAAYRELERIEQACLDDIVKVLEYGVRKYARDNWMHVPEWERRYTAARNRHILAYLDADGFDDESELHHLAHAMCCELFLIHMRNQASAR